MLHKYFFASSTPLTVSFFPMQHAYRYSEIPFSFSACRWRFYPVTTHLRPFSYRKKTNLFFDPHPPPRKATHDSRDGNPQHIHRSQFFLTVEMHPTAHHHHPPWQSQDSRRPTTTIVCPQLPSSTTRYLFWMHPTRHPTSCSTWRQRRQPTTQFYHGVHLLSNATFSKDDLYHMASTAFLNTWRQPTISTDCMLQQRSLLHGVDCIPTSYK